MGTGPGCVRGAHTGTGVEGCGRGQWGWVIIKEQLQPH